MGYQEIVTDYGSNEKISKNLESMLVYYTKDIGEAEQNRYLKELLEETRDEVQYSFSQLMENLYTPKIDIQQDIVLDDIDKDKQEELDFFSRKLLLLDRAGIQLSSDIYMFLAFYFLLSSYYSDALDVLIRNLDYIDNTGFALNLLAVIFYKHSKRDESLEVLEDAIKRGMKEDIIYYNSALLFYMVGDYTKAVKYLEGREHKLSGRSNYFLCLADSLYNLGEMGRSAIYFEKYLYKNPKNLSVLSKLIDVHYEGENYSKALKFIDTFEENDGDTSNMLFKKAVCLYFTNRINESMLVLAKLLGIERKYLDNKGRDYLFGLFVETFRVGLSDIKVFKVFRSEMESENWDSEMIEYLITQVKNIEVEDLDSMCFLGILNKQTGKTDEARTIFENILSKDPNHYEAMNWLALCYYELGEKRSTIELYQQLVLKNKANKELSLIASKIYIENEDMHNAKQSALNAYNMGLRNIEIYKMLGYIFIELKDLEKAYDFYLKAQKIEPNDLEIQNQLGVVHLLAERYNDAALIFKRIVKKDPNFGEAHYNLGVTYKKILEEESQSHINKYYEISGSKKDTKKEKFYIED